MADHTEGFSTIFDESLNGVRLLYEDDNAGTRRMMLQHTPDGQVHSSSLTVSDAGILKELHGMYTVRAHTIECAALDLVQRLSILFTEKKRESLPSIDDRDPFFDGDIDPSFVQWHEKICFVPSSGMPETFSVVQEPVNVHDRWFVYDGQENAEEYLLLREIDLFIRSIRARSRRLLERAYFSVLNAQRGFPEFKSEDGWAEMDASEGSGQA